MSNKPIPPRRPDPASLKRLATFFSKHQTKIIVGIYFAAGLLEQISQTKRPVTPRRRSSKAARRP